jgi:hypothetical protein
MPQPRGHAVVMQAIPKKRGRKKKVIAEGWDLLIYLCYNFYSDNFLLEWWLSWLVLNVGL